MKTQYLVATVNSPHCYMAAAGGLTYQLEKALNYKTKEEAEQVIKQLHLGAAWKVVAHND